MAIDTSLFGVDIPAGSYSKGDVVQLGNIAGPSVVRSGRGEAKLKRVTSGLIGSVSGSLSFWKIFVKNSDWVDPMISGTTWMGAATALDERTGAVQRGNDCPLTQNSAWEVYAVCVANATTTVDNSLFAAIDIDYPSVSSITDPDTLLGIPTSIVYTGTTIAINALGTIASSTWDSVNVDIFKAGYEYALQKVEMMANQTCQGFIAISNAAGMGGLTRIIPISQNVSAIRNKIEYATKLQKGPMDIRYLIFADSGTGTTDNPELIFDFVKRRM